MSRYEKTQRPHDECGVFGIYDHPEAAKLTYFGLYALQHRGQESAGIAVAKDKKISIHKGMGLVPDVFDIDHLEQLQGGSAIGHVRYSTTGSSVLSNAQPFVVNHMGKSYAVAHNGNLVNAHNSDCMCPVEALACVEIELCTAHNALVSGCGFADLNGPGNKTCGCHNL